jgi:hypothetical protein
MMNVDVVRCGQQFIIYHIKPLMATFLHFPLLWSFLWLAHWHITYVVDSFLYEKNLGEVVE